MKSFSRADTLFAILIVATVVLKLIILRSEPPIIADVTSSRIQSVFQVSGLSTKVVPEPPASDVVVASRGLCRMWARDYEPYGTFLTDFTAQAAPFGRLDFIYQGRVFHRPPKIGPLMRFYIARELARVGLKPTRPPIIAVAATRNCDLNKIRWDELAEVPW